MKYYKFSQVLIHHRTGIKDIWKQAIVLDFTDIEVTELYLRDFIYHPTDKLPFLAGEEGGGGKVYLYHNRPLIFWKDLFFRGPFIKFSKIRLVFYLDFTSRSINLKRKWYSDRVISEKLYYCENVELIANPSLPIPSKEIKLLRDVWIKGDLLPNWIKTLMNKEYTNDSSIVSPLNPYY